MNTNEGCATISDNNGNLLFYTDGIKVWNRNGQVMPNGSGLKGDPSSSNSAIVIPKPGSASIYYIFTADAGENDNAKGYCYTEVDMTMAGGLGDVTANKNILLYAPSSEQLTAVRHANGIDVWVITKEWGNNQWDVFKIDCNGVNSTPVVSVGGTVRDSLLPVVIAGVPGFWNEGSVGCLKPSPDEKRLAATDFANGCWEILDFDNSTGLLSNPLIVPQEHPYGIEFSPDSRMVYVVSESRLRASPEVVQYSLASYDSVSIASSAVVIGKSRGGDLGALQVGPDGKIYCIMENLDSLAVINAPNVPGLGSSMVFSQVYLDGREGIRGLPVFFPGLIANQNVDLSFAIGNDCSTVTFTGTSSVAGPLNWSWDFGDGTTGSGQNVSHAYASGGVTVDTVRLTVTAPSVCGLATAVATKVVDLGRLVPTARFGFSARCGDPLVAFSDSSSLVGGTIRGWLWDFGDGVTSSQQNPVHVFGSFGAQTVRLSVTSAGVCNGTTVSTVVVPVEAKPVADFSSAGVCGSMQVAYADLSVGSVQPIAKWQWDLGDGDSSTAQNPSHGYAAFGDYNVGLVAVSASGCPSDTVRKTVRVNAKPVAGFDFRNGCVGQQVAFNDKSTVTGAGAVDQWFWDLGGGNFSTIADAAATYAGYGNYSVKLVVGSDRGCVSDTVSRVISVEPKPAASFSATDGCADSVLALTNTSTIAFGGIGSYYWSFGNGDSSLAVQPSYIYSRYGTYTIGAVAISKNGCISDTAYATVNIQAAPSVEFGFGPACVGKEVDFTNGSEEVFGAIVSWAWDFGDGEGSGLYAPGHTYDRYMEYGVSLAAVTGNGCRATASRVLSIRKVEVSAGRDTTVAIGQPLQLVASGASTYSWTPATGLNDAAIGNPVAELSGNMTYYLTGVTGEGCVGYDTLNVTVYKGPDIYVPSAFSPNADGRNDVFKPVYAGTVELYYFSVYNRWGQLVFTTKEVGKGWDGKIDGRDQPTGTYVWILRAKDYLGHVVEKKGTVLLLR